MTQSLFFFPPPLSLSLASSRLAHLRGYFFILITWHSSHCNARALCSGQTRKFREGDRKKERKRERERATWAPSVLRDSVKASHFWPAGGDICAAAKLQIEMQSKGMPMSSRAFGMRIVFSSLFLFLFRGSFSFSSSSSLSVLACQSLHLITAFARSTNSDSVVRICLSYDCFLQVTLSLPLPLFLSFFSFTWPPRCPRIAIAASSTTQC